MPNIKILLQMLIFVSILAGGHVFWKFGLIRIDGFMTNSKGFVQGLRDLATCPQMWLGGVMYIVGTLFWFTIISRENLSYVAPMAAMGYILTSIAGLVIFHETIAFTGWIGMAIILLGSVILSIR